LSDVIIDSASWWRLGIYFLTMLRKHQSPQISQYKTTETEGMKGRV